MRTPEEILRECTVNTVYSTDEKIKQLTTAMKIYANQKIDEVISRCKIKKDKSYATISARDLHLLKDSI